MIPIHFIALLVLFFCYAIFERQSKFSEIPFHPSARSSVFNAMFAYDDMKESQNNRVEITDVLPDVMQDLLQYIYTGTTQAIEKIPEEILQAAEKVSARRLMLPLFLIT